MKELKTISKSAVEAAFERAKHYRLLNEPEQAESICLDILEADPENAPARKTLILALSDQFDTRLSAAYREAMEVIGQLEGDYERAYFEGVVYERRARAHHRSTSPGKGHAAYDSLQSALDAYARAEAIRPEGNDESLLRWNACVRTMQRHPDIEPEFENAAPQLLE